MLSERYDAALVFASKAHRNQTRKNGNVPYIAHPLRVSAATLEYGATEDVAIAALLHDVVEDCGGMTIGERVRREFGERVLRTVLDVSDSTTEDPEQKRPWRERKERYLARMREAPDDSLLVAACDKIDNAASLARLLGASNDRDAILSRFRGGRDGTIWYYETFLEIVKTRSCPAENELEWNVDLLLRRLERRRNNRL